MISVNDNLIISPYVDDITQFLIENKSTERKTIVNKATNDLIIALKEMGSCEEDAFYDNYMRQDQFPIVRDEFDQVIISLSKLGIILNDEVEVKKKKHRYLKVRFTILPQKLVNRLSLLFQFLYAKSYLYIGYTVPLIILYIIINGDQIIQAFPQNDTSFYLISTLCLYCSVLFHEIGHATALKARGLPPGEIGFGLYLFVMPVFYTNLDEIWKLPAKKRFLVNIGGVYFQYIFSLIFFIWGLFEPKFMIIVVLILFSVIYQFNPLIRLDGYWIASDYFKLTDVVKQSNEKLILLTVDLLRNQPLKYSKKEYLLILYGLFSGTYIILIYFFLIANLWDSIILQLPSRYKEIQEGFNWDKVLTVDFLNQIAPLLVCAGILLGLSFFFYRFILFINKVYNELNRQKQLAPH